MEKKQDWSKIRVEKVGKMLTILKGLTIYQANDVINSLNKAIENNTIIN